MFVYVRRILQVRLSNLLLKIEIISFFELTQELKSAKIKAEKELILIGGWYFIYECNKCKIGYNI